MTPDPTKVLAKATFNAAKALGLDKQELATAIGISVEQLDKPDCQELAFQPGTDAGQRCMLLIRLYDALVSQVGNDQEQIGRWLRSHNSAVEGIPLTEISSLAGLVKVVVYLEQLLECGYPPRAKRPSMSLQ